MPRGFIDLPAFNLRLLLRTLARRTHREKRSLCLHWQHLP
jgi:hypothetical protein